MTVSKKSEVIDGNEVISRWMEANKGKLFDVIARTAVFCPKTVFEAVKGDGNTAYIKNKDGLLFVRRLSREGKKGHLDSSNKYILDDNTYINQAFKKLCGGDQRKYTNFITCHIYGGLSRNPKIFSAIANIVLLPKALAGLSDHCDEVMNLLQHRAYELYRWYPKEEGYSVPKYQDEFAKLPWSNPEDFKECEPWEEGKIPIGERIKVWRGKPESIVYKTIEIVKNNPKIEIKELKRKLIGISSNPDVTISSLQTDSGNAYGKVLRRDGDKISLNGNVANLWK